MRRTTIAGIEDISLRQLRSFATVARLGSITRAAERHGLTQSALTQSIHAIERLAGTTLLSRLHRAVVLTSAGELLSVRAERVFELVDPPASALSPRLPLLLTMSNLAALAAAADGGSFVAAARELNKAPPSVHRSISQLEEEAGRPLLERTTRGLVPTDPALALILAYRLAATELRQAQADIADLLGRPPGAITIGAMPVARSYIVPQAVAAFRRRGRHIPIRVQGQPYRDLIVGLQRGEIDFLVGALRITPPPPGISETVLVTDHIVAVCDPGHPLFEELAGGHASAETLSRFPWVVGTSGTPNRQHFDLIFDSAITQGLTSLVETGSIVLMKELLKETQHIGFISRFEVAIDLESGLLRQLPVAFSSPEIKVGLTTRSAWMPSRVQEEFLHDIVAAATRAPNS